LIIFRPRAGSHSILFAIMLGFRLFFCRCCGFCNVPELYDLAGEQAFFVVHDVAKGRPFFSSRTFRHRIRNDIGAHYLRVLPCSRWSNTDPTLLQFMSSATSSLPDLLKLALFYPHPPRFTAISGTPPLILIPTSDKCWGFLSAPAHPPACAVYFFPREFSGPQVNAHLSPVSRISPSHRLLWSEPISEASTKRVNTSDSLIRHCSLFPLVGRLLPHSPHPFFSCAFASSQSGSLSPPHQLLSLPSGLLLISKKVPTVLVSYPLFLF